MCGRYSLGLQHDEIQQMHGYNVNIGEWVGRDNFVPRHNIAPRSQAPVIRRRDPQEPAADSEPSREEPQAASTALADGPIAQPGLTQADNDKASSSAEVPAESSVSDTAGTLAGSQAEVEIQKHARDGSSPPLILHTMKWGLVPHFSKHEDPSLKTINARCEALIEGQAGMWASIKGRKRCAVVCEGYYEWLKKGKERLPHFTRHKDGRLMLLAGLWDCTVLQGSTEPLWTFTIVTTDASKEFSWLHDRQPVILPDESALNTWLDTSSGKWTPELSKLCAPYRYSEHPLVCYQVPKEVGKIGTESPTFIQPIQGRKDGIQALFAKQQKGTSKHERKDVVTATPPSPRTPTRAGIKRSASPAESSVKTEGVGATPQKKKQKVEKVNAWEDDSDIEYIDDPTPSNAATERKKLSSSNKVTRTSSGRHVGGRRCII
ncbi:DUF159-domain-containing protein [Trametes coccinea BRFM310]|uniref:DUF159-domain-containing protein n=1 Tax=Trametes coccinea (strain BRFM310) TaxID=1353009 RepID=A0A1Y2IRD6_TRAC3|nr:DUF159-domain-containing protein [Trametes coccinea BRFM310]